MQASEPKPKRRVKFPAICDRAEKLGVSRNHLFKVLSGERRSDSLLVRYRELCAVEDAAKGAAQIAVPSIEQSASTPTEEAQTRAA